MHYFIIFSFLFLYVTMKIDLFYKFNDNNVSSYLDYLSKRGNLFKIYEQFEFSYSFIISIYWLLVARSSRLVQV